MGQALYRKHRPKSLKEVIGQEHITDTLAKALEQGRISHAYLFTGPRGVGKTSIARILAHEINGLPYTDDSMHLDIIEIDAASNRRIDEIRELRDKVHVAPTSAKYKVYIIDEVHMLTKEAFNALLKTLEEPPAHVVFILATTDAHKLPETIVSRTQRYTFKPVSQAQVATHLGQIAKQEKLAVSPEALELLAEHGEGSFRDSISLLDQAASQGRSLEAADVRMLLGIPPAEAIQALLDDLCDGGEAAGLMARLSALYGSGYQAATVAKQLSQLLRRDLLGGKSSFSSGQTIDVLGKLIEVPQSRDPERYLEIVLLGVLPTHPATAAVASAATELPEPALVSPPSETPIPFTEEASMIIETPPEPLKLTPKPQAVQSTATLDGTVWPQVLLALKQKHNTLYGVVRMAEPSFSEPGIVRLTFAFAFHEKRIKEASNRQKLADIIQELTGKVVGVECQLDKSARPPKIIVPAAKTPPPANLTTISNIFGGAELLES